MVEIRWAPPEAKQAYEALGASATQIIEEYRQRMSQEAASGKNLRKLQEECHAVVQPLYDQMEKIAVKYSALKVR